MKQNLCQCQLPVPRFCPRWSTLPAPPNITDWGQQSLTSPPVLFSPSSIPNPNASVYAVSAQNAPVGDESVGGMKE